MKTLHDNNEPVNTVVGKDRTRNLYEVIFDAKQINPRVTIGSTWIALDKRYSRKYLMRVVDMGYSDDYDLKQILGQIRDSPTQGFDSRAYEYYCAEKAWVRIEGELSDNGLETVYDQPTVLQTFLRPTTPQEDITIADADPTGFAIGYLRSGDKQLAPVVTLEDLFVGHRTLITGSSGFGKSTLVRNIARFWIENGQYGKIIDDIKGEYIQDIKDETGKLVSGLCHHPLAKNKLYLLTSTPSRYEELQQAKLIADIIPLKFSIDDIPVDSLKDVATHISDPQRTFLEMYQDKPNLFRILLQEDSDGDPDTSNWHKLFKGWIVLNKDAKENAKSNEGASISVSDIMPSSYTPIHSIIKQLKRLVFRPFMTLNKSLSCLGRIHELLKNGATIILDKSSLTDSDRIIISTVLANDLYKHNAEYSSGNRERQRQVIPFVYLVEEAHLLLSTAKIREGSVFVDFSKTGRSFQIGLVAITQRPSSLDRDIITQFDNFITLRLTNETDVKDLLNACDMFKGYEGDIRSVGRGCAVTAFGEPTKVQSIKVFEWTESRAKSLLSTEQQKTT
jgi:energy-coupling factor transporter ATP-binding protein EcfA2